LTDAHQYFLQVGNTLPDITESKLFGKPCFKIDGRAFACFFEDEMVFKLDGDTHIEALSLDGSYLFDPSKKGRPMKEWVQVPYDYKEKWAEFAESALAYVGDFALK
jgi:hypothetical protein